MSLPDIANRIPTWLISILVLVLLAVFLERTYISQKPILFWGKQFGPAATSAGGGGRTEIWFDLKTVPHGHDECVRRADSALRMRDFKQGGINDGVTAYGYKDGLVGTIWCVKENQLALIAVAGPSGEYAAEQRELVKSFYAPQP